MNPWIAKAVVLAASVVLVVIRAPYGSRSRRVKVVTDRADYPLRLVPLAMGIVCFVIGLWLFRRSHVDLGDNWSITLQVREQHRLVTGGVYRRIRHPMYAALFLYSIGQVLVLPNWVAGPSYLVTFGILYALRVRAEERMMLETFGSDYATYIGRTRRLVPGVW